MKMSTKKRALVSSVAMLLVAMIALGTATFAWFTQNTTATADNIYVKTSKASSLEISKSDRSWGTYIDYGVGGKDSAQIMYPASTANGTTWVTANATGANGAIDTSSLATVTPASSNPKYVFAEELNIMNAGLEGKITDIKITISWPDTSCGYLNLALVEADSEGNFTGTFTDSVYSKTAEAYTGISGASTTASITSKESVSISVDDLDAGDVAYYKLYIWFEGQDSECIDTNAGQSVPGIEFTVTGEPA